MFFIYLLIATIIFSQDLAAADMQFKRVSILKKGIYVWNNTDTNIVVWLQRQMYYTMQKNESFVSYAQSEKKVIKPGQQKKIHYYRPDIVLDPKGEYSKKYSTDIQVKRIEFSPVASLYAYCKSQNDEKTIMTDIQMNDAILLVEIRLVAQ